MEEIQSIDNSQLDRISFEFNQNPEIFEILKENSNAKDNESTVKRFIEKANND